eukprot:s97_g6.t1
MAAMLDSQATFKERMNQLGVEEALQSELQAKGFNTYGSGAFAVSTTPQQITDAILDAWLAQVTSRNLSAFQMSCIRRLVVESHALALSDLQRKVEAPPDTAAAARKLPVAERQTRQKEQEERLEGIIFSPEVTPSHALVDLCVSMLEQSVLTWIKPEECTSRAQEIQSLKKDSKVAIDADGNIKISSKAAALTCSVTSELDLRNAFQRRSLAMDQAKLCSFREIEKWVQHLFLSHDRSQPPGFAAVTLQQIIECDKQMFIRASNNLVGNVQAEPGAKETPLDKEIQTLRTSPELLPYLMPMQTKTAGFAFSVPTNPRINTLASQHRQHRQRQQLIPEYRQITWLPPDTPLDEWQHYIPSSQRGKVQEGEDIQLGDIQLGEEQVPVGTWHTPEEFVEKALTVAHPMDDTSVSSVTLEAIQFVVGTDPRLVEIERKKNLLKAKIRAKQLERQEQDFHESLAAPVEKVVKGKKLLLWKQLLEELDYDDMGEPGFAAHLVETAREEKELDFLEGPFRSEEEVTNHLGHSDWRVIRRFVIQQGQKLRPIDDGLEAQINAAYTSTIRLDLQDADYVIAMVLELSRWPGMKWCGKTLDLSKAYKQLPILPGHGDLAVVHFKDESGAPVFYVPNSQMFGSTAAVFAFNRVSRSLWFLINRYLKIPSAVYFDDFPMFAPRDSAPAADEVVSDFLDLLGWKHDRTGPKGKPFEFSFDVLGLTLDLADIPRGGGLVLKNKEGRVEKICQKVEEVRLKGSLSLTDAQELHGLLHFATGYFAGRFLKYACFKIFSLVSKDGHRSSGLQRWCEDVLTLLRAAQPRTIPLNIDTRTVVVFTDGSWESGVAGIGACLFDESHGIRLVIQDKVADEMLALWKNIVGDHLICQIELYTMVLVRWEFQDLLSNRRVLLFVDNNSARGGVVKGRSSSPTMDDLLKAFYSAETHHPSFWWVERVPSKSNPGDAPSRFEGQKAARDWGADFRIGFRCSKDLNAWLLKTAANRQQSR